MARAYQPQPWSSDSGLSFEPTQSTGPYELPKRRLVSRGEEISFSERLHEEFLAHKGYYRFIVGAGLFVVIIIGLAMYTSI